LTRELLLSASFIRAAKRMLKKHPDKSEDMQVALELISVNVFDHRLKTHKLKGEFEGSWACSLGYDFRIIFSFVPYQGSEAILLESIGTHEEVY
jgi:addiction module RelE/StbE family toxin